MQAIVGGNVRGRLRKVYRGGSWWWLYYTHTHAHTRTYTHTHAHTRTRNTTNRKVYFNSPPLSLQREWLVSIDRLQTPAWQWIGVIRWFINGNSISYAPNLLYILCYKLIRKRAYVFFFRFFLSLFTIGWVGESGLRVCIHRMAAARCGGGRWCTFLPWQFFNIVNPTV